MTELGVSDEQFVAACEKAEKNPIHKKIVDQIMAVDNFLAFKKLMVKRNQELNKQAIEMFEKLAAKEKSGTSEAPTATGAPPKEEAKVQVASASGAQSEEEKKKETEALKEVMRVAHSLERAEEEEMMKKALEESEKLKTQ